MMQAPSPESQSRRMTPRPSRLCLPESASCAERTARISVQRAPRLQSTLGPSLGESCEGYHVLLWVHCRRTLVGGSSRIEPNKFHALLPGSTRSGTESPFEFAGFVMWAPGFSLVKRPFRRGIQWVHVIYLSCFGGSVWKAHVFPA